MIGLLRRTFMPRMLPVAAAVLLVSLSAQARDFALPDWSEAPPMQLPAPMLEVNHLYAPPAPDSAESRMVVKPAEAIERWARSRLVPTGGQWLAELVIVDAGVRSEAMATTHGVAGWFRREQAERHTLRLEVELRMAGPSGAVATLRAHAEQTGTVGENPREGEREVLWHSLLEEAMRSLDRELENRARADLANLVQ